MTPVIAIQMVNVLTHKISSSSSLLQYNTILHVFDNPGELIENKQQGQPTWHESFSNAKQFCKHITLLVTLRYINISLQSGHSCSNLRGQFKKLTPSLYIALPL